MDFITLNALNHHLIFRKISEKIVDHFFLKISCFDSSVNKLERRPHQIILQGNVVVLTRLKTSFYPYFLQGNVVFFIRLKTGFKCLTVRFLLHIYLFDFSYFSPTGLVST